MSTIWDKITGKDDSNHPITETAATNPVATDATTRTNPLQEDDHPFSFNKLKEALGGHSPAPKTPDLPPPVTITHVEHSESHDKDAWHEKALLVSHYQLVTATHSYTSFGTYLTLAPQTNERQRKKGFDLKGHVVKKLMIWNLH
jgi:hypothetical protein